MTRSASASPALPVLMILGSCTSLQFGSALAAGLFPYIGSWGTTSLRLGLAAIVLSLAVRPRPWRLSAGQWRAVLLFGLVIGTMNGFFYAAVERLPLGTAVTIEFLGPLGVAALLSSRRGDLLWVALALLGISLFGLESFLGADVDLLGALFALVAALFWGLYVLASAEVGRVVPGQDGLALALGIGALAILPIGWRGAVEGILEPRLLAAALGTAVLASVLPYTLELTALRRLPRHVFGILLSLEPVIALIAGVVLLGQHASPLRIAAAVIVVAASAGVTLTARRPEEPGEESSEDPSAQDLPIPTHATVTGEIPIVTAEEWLEEDPDGVSGLAGLDGVVDRADADEEGGERS